MAGFKRSNMDKCPVCGAEEIEILTPVTVYACGSSDYDRRPITFRQGKRCKKTRWYRKLIERMSKQEKDIADVLNPEKQ